MQWTDVTLEHVATETDRVLATADRLDDAAAREPSRCAGWSRGHVLTHLARNADALARVCSVALTGVPDTMYDSPEARDADIDAGADRPAAELASDIRASADQFALVAGKLEPSHAGVRVERTPGERHIPVEKVLFMRLRELVYHHVDLDAGFTFRDAPTEVVGLFLTDSVKRLAGDSSAPGLTIHTTEGDTHVVGDGATTVRGPRADVLLWLAREDTSGVELDGPVPTLPFGG